MNFEDSLKIGANVYDVGYAEVGGKYYSLADGQKYTYVYEIYAPLNKAKYPLIPKEGDKVHITKKDGTIDKEMEVKGFVTLKKRFLRIWL